MTDEPAAESAEQEPLGWAVIELMGHRRLGGYVREVQIAGAGMLRIDIPDAGAYPSQADGGGVYATQFYPPSALYCLTPCTREMALAVARRNRPEPVQRWELPAPRESVQTHVDADFPEDVEEDDTEDDAEGWWEAV